MSQSVPERSHGTCVSRKGKDRSRYVPSVPRSRYRWRTRLRVALPFRPPLYLVVLKGRRDCGEHGWYNADNVVEHCIYCRAERSYDEAHFPAQG